jgi:hypothetical protein
VRLPLKLRDEDNAVQLVTKYFADDPRTGRARYPGAWFSRLGGGGDQPPTADQITAEDLVAASTVGVRVVGYYALDVLEYQAPQIGELLALIPNDVTLADDAAADLIAADAPAWRLFELLRAIRPKNEGGGRLGPVAAGALLARKRPHLIPIYDRHVKGTFGRTGQDQAWWSQLRQLLTGDDGLVRELEAVRRRVGVGDASLLRVLDVMCRMYDQL